METRLIQRGTIVLLCLCCVQFVLWSGQYFYWPWWSDHDVFSTVARSWDAGYLPYRDQLCNNFPGTIYQFWLVGKLFGWGNTGAYNAFDQLLFLLLVATLLSWSYRRFASLLPGAIATASLCSYYFNQDFSMVAQRDWHAALWCAMAIMVLNSGPTRLSMALGALCYAFGLVIRPQVVSWAPALVLALDEQVRRPCEPLARTAPRAIAGASLTAMLLVLFFMPILGNGVWGDFLRCVTTAASSTYRDFASPARWIADASRTVLPLKSGAVLAALILMASCQPDRRRLVRSWLVSWACCIVYLCLTPRAHAYSAHPYWLFWSLNLAVLSQLILSMADLSSSMKVITLLLVLALSVSALPRYCRPDRFREALRDRGLSLEAEPTGFYVAPGNTLILTWSSYRSLLDYLTEHLGPRTRIANALSGIAVAGPLGRLSAFPAESLTWLSVVSKADEPRFEASLREATDSVVVWSPDQPGPRSIQQFPLIKRAIQELYQPMATFQGVQVWGRRSKPASGRGRLGVAADSDGLSG